MDKNEIVSFLEKNKMSDIEEIEYKKDATVIRFFYDFDEDEIKAAKAYAKDECDEDEGSEAWKEDYFKPYLNDLAVDNVGEIIEDYMEEYDNEAQFVSYEVNEEEKYMEFIAVFYNVGESVDMDDVLEELNL